MQARKLPKDFPGGERQRIRRRQYMQGFTGIAKQRLPQRLLQLANLGAHGGLGQAKLLGGSRVGALAMYGLKHLQLAKRQAVEQRRG